MISICITTYNRDSMTVDSFSQVHDDPRISEVVIVDDHSNVEIFNLLAQKLEPYSKARLFRNAVNLDCYRNKREAVSKASNEWVILLDSDNVIDKSYLDHLPKFPEKNFVYQPEYAKPHFNFKNFSGMTITKHNVGHNMADSSFQTMLNAMNYFVNRDEYLHVWDESIDPVTSDSLYQNYNWLKFGNCIYVCPELQYGHTIHNGSHYRLNVNRTPRGFHEDIINKLKLMK